MKHFTEEHEWVEKTADGTYRIGITNYAQEQLGDVVAVELPEAGQALAKGDSCGTIESVKAASDIYAPAAGEVVKANETLIDSPNLVNDSPEQDGWLWEMKVSDESDLEGLMDEAAYQAFAGN